MERSHPFIPNIPDQHLDLRITLFETDFHPFSFFTNHLVLQGLQFEEEINDSYLKGRRNLFQDRKRFLFNFNRFDLSRKNREISGLSGAVF